MSLADRQTRVGELAYGRAVTQSEIEDDKGDLPVVGRVLGTQPASPLTYWTALVPGRWLQLDDVVVTSREVAGRGTVVTSGIVTHVQARHEGASFESDVHLIADGTLPGEVVEAAEITVTRVEPEIYVPPTPGSAVRRALDDERDAALYFDSMDRMLPIGLGRDRRPVYANFDFVDGTKGAHISISGISGVATKTSYALFLLHSVFTSQVLGAKAVNTKALVYCVKGEDLLYLDYPNTALTADQALKYAELGLPAQPFKSVHVFAPPRPGDPAGTPNISGRAGGAVSPMFWTLQEFCRDELLSFCFADAEDDRAQYTLLIGQVAARLKREADPIGESGAISIASRTVTTWSALVDLIDEQLTDEDTRRDWTPGATALGSINAFLRRLHSSVRPLDALIRGDLDLRGRQAVSTSEAQVTVVDLHSLPDRAQRFVVGTTLRRQLLEKEASGSSDPLTFIVLDELNKYAPREGSHPIKEILLDVAERGRSLGVILIGAQQTASEVERRIVANCAIKVAGRLDAAEATRPEYGYLPATHRQRALLAKPGSMFVSQPDIPLPLAIEFPFPAWATRISEAGTPPTPPASKAAERRQRDPFARVADQPDPGGDPAPF
ncbi:ATP-binding protein [Nocardioides sp. URHA0020]|uniref:ATP-binding protein n=1 Tax=Nocardioides sp. URHA0020 TaxID=1380392 RepID=UPI0018CC07FA|nr:ATP-binding protein [Nocardioides sp. URHA0020]